jgi:2,3-bisphosphoglycerate-dependent phosphoglycerate mutase
MRRFLLVRHAQSSGQAPDAPLTELGHAQARALAESLAEFPIDAVVCSPYLRARQTIEPFAARAGVAMRLDARLAERRLSPEPIADWRDVVARSFRELDHGVPGGESGRETLERGWAALQELLAGPHQLPLAVSHGQLIALVLHSLDAGFGFAGWESLSNPDVHLVEVPAPGRGSFRRVHKG